MNVLLFTPPDVASNFSRHSKMLVYNEYSFIGLMIFTIYFLVLTY